MRRLWLLFWMGVLWPSCSAVVGCVESIWYLPQYEEGQARIEEVRAEVYETGTWPHVEWWSDRQDPLGGFFDFASRPWVSAARGSGDCDDAMVLAEEILRGYHTLRVFVESSLGWHAALLWLTSNGWVVISNMVLLPWIANSPAEVAAMIFGSDTINIFIF
jgi:hypothetical protein